MLRAFPLAGVEGQTRHAWGGVAPAHLDAPDWWSGVANPSTNQPINPSILTYVIRIYVNPSIIIPFFLLINYSIKYITVI